MLLTNHGSYGVRIGNQIAFTNEGAVEIYKAFLDVCYSDLSLEGSLVLSEVQNDLVNAGFTWEEVEQIETDYIKEVH